MQSQYHTCKALINHRRLGGVASRFLVISKVRGKGLLSLQGGILSDQRQDFEDDIRVCLSKPTSCVIVILRLSK